MSGEDNHFISLSHSFVFFIPISVWFIIMETDPLEISFDRGKKERRSGTP
jgi:hypothetical protein